MADAITTARAFKRKYATFPLTIHAAAGPWCKKHLGRTHYFGKLADPKAARKRYEREWEYIVEGKTPPLETGNEACSLRTLCNAFLASKRNALAAGELSPLSYRDYYRACGLLIDHFGRTRKVESLRPADFESLRAKLAPKYGVTTLLGWVNRIRVVLKYASDQRLIPQPVHYGQSFDRPSRKLQRRMRIQAETRQFTATELRQILDALQDDPQLRAMTLLAINAGLGVTDCAELRGAVALVVFVAGLKTGHSFRKPAESP
jgi:hypothetical protein